MRLPCTSSKSCLSCCFVASFANSDFHVTNFRLPFVTSAYDNNGFTVSSTDHVRARRGSSDLLCNIISLVRDWLALDQSIRCNLTCNLKLARSGTQQKQTHLYSPSWQNYATPVQALKLVQCFLFYRYYVVTGIERI